MAMYEDFDLDIKVGTKQNENTVDGKGIELRATVNCTGDSCICSLDTCGGDPHFCDR